MCVGACACLRACTSVSVCVCMCVHVHAYGDDSPLICMQSINAALQQSESGPWEVLTRLTRLISLDLEEGVLLDEASEEGLRGGSFFNRRLLSNPFSRGEWAGLALGEAGSCCCEAGRSVKPEKESGTASISISTSFT